MSSGIYKIQNIINGKIYIGSSKNIHKRLQIHKRELIKNKHLNPKLQAAWNKHGECAFVFKEIFACAKCLLLDMEQLYIDCCFGDNCYNINPCAVLPPRNPGGRVYSDEARRNLSNARKRDGIKPPSRKGTIPWNKGKSCGPSWNKGKHHSESHKQKLKEAWIKRKLKLL